MRNFIIVGHRAITSPKLSLNDLPGAGGRMDLLTRCVTSVFCISHDIRRDMEAALVLLGPEDPPKVVRFVGAELKYLNPDERSTGALIRNALVKYQSFKLNNDIEHAQEGNANKISLSSDKSDTNQDVYRLKESGLVDNSSLPGEIRSSPGIYVSKNGLPEALEHYKNRSKLIHVKEDGLDINKTTLEENDTFILSDHLDFTVDEEKLVKEYSTLEISVGPVILHTNQCITVIQNVLDRTLK